VKRGRGGIREIEFFAQTHQLIHGGRDPSLRVRGTRAALDALAHAGRISPEDAAILGAGYDRLREIEHRLQMVNDRQTHSLPDGAALDNVAQLDGLADGAALVAELTELTQRTGSIYEQLIGPRAAPTHAVVQTSDLASWLGELGFDEPETLGKRIEGWSEGRFACLRTPQALRAFAALQPLLIKAMAASDDPMRAITRWESILERVPSAITLFQLLVAQPALLNRLVATLTLAPVLSDELARRPELLDTLLDRDALDLPGDIPAIMARMEAKAARRDYEALLDAIRVVTGEVRFALGVQLIEGLADPLDIAHALSRLAEAALALAMQGAVREFEGKHGRIPGGELLVLGLGRLGGGALTHASDLDIVYLFTGDFAARSDGTRPLGATQYFNRLASRVSAALSVPTAQGALYEVDTRLRPQGNQGPLAVSCEAFAKYQREAAWTWEHMALARARVLVGSAPARVALQAILGEVIRAPRDVDTLRAAVVDMRERMAEHKQPGGPVDCKLLRGGLVDLEFIVQFLQLRGQDASGVSLSHSHPNALDPDLSVAIGALVTAGLLPPEIALAHELMTRMLVAGRLLAPGGKEPPACGAKALAQACGQGDYTALLHTFGEARQRIAGVWKAILGTDILDMTQETER
jgi:glutamate-ammonia-ligase adenylyltransferase